MTKFVAPYDLMREIASAMNIDSENLLQEQQIFSHAHRLPVNQTRAIEIAERRELAQAEMAMTRITDLTRAFVLCSPESWLDLNPTQFHLRLDSKRTPEPWRMVLGGWERRSLHDQWSYRPDIGVPDDSALPAHDSPTWPGADAAVISGPPIADVQPTLVAVMAISLREKDQYQSEEQKLVRGQEYGSIQSRGVCVDQKGQVIQESTWPFGLRPSLCRCGNLVVGVDRTESGWRLWNWAATQETEPRQVLSLDPTCQRVAVYAMPTAGWFWLVEELLAEVRVSKREAGSLAEVALADRLTGYRFLPDRDYAFDPANARPLEGHRNSGLLVYGETLLLLLLDEQGEMELLQAT